MKKLFPMTLIIIFSLLFCFCLLSCGEDDPDEDVVEYDSDYPFKGTWKGTATFFTDKSSVSSVFTKDGWTYKCPDEDDILKNVSGTYSEANSYDYNGKTYAHVAILNATKINNIESPTPIPFGVAEFIDKDHIKIYVRGTFYTYYDPDNHSDLKKTK